MKPTFEVPDSLVLQWRTEDAVRNVMGETYIDFDIFAQLAAQWGADQELDACADLIDKNIEIDYDTLYHLRRPKSKKLQVFEALEKLYDGVNRKENKMFILNILGKIDEKYFEELNDD